MGLFGLFGGGSRTPRQVIWTTHATNKRKYYGLSKKTVMGAFNRPTRVESYKKTMTKAIRSYKNYDVGVLYKRKRDGTYVIISCWYYPTHY